MSGKDVLVKGMGLAVVSLALLNGNAIAKVYDIPVVDPVNFTSPVDNLWLPMAVGSTYAYEAEEEDGLIRNEITATSETKEILGVTCTVVYDVEWIYVEDLGEWFMTEETDDWYAWDNWGNVWYFGEFTTEFLYDDDWNLIGTSNDGSWEGGVDGAIPGILMLAMPKHGLSYLQEYYEGEAEDTARVLRMNSHISIDYGDFWNCLVTKEWTPLDPGVVELKFYAPGVGLVYIQELKEKTVRVELVDIF